MMSARRYTNCGTISVDYSSIIFEPCRCCLPFDGHQVMGPGTDDVSLTCKASPTKIQTKKNVHIIHETIWQMMNDFLLVK